ncbi:hypothetical protein ILUMI_13692 [Ignelater luminosus]|uniref:Transposase Tc1-like domain-containing protein n=1 Tax=Ignelater luminosus TaxID=2038154 RepID=A0A8K0CXB3_IGNLU|nr:hypothetical protein ILUMI_13692 [Ignelater luminosus]
MPRGKALSNDLHLSIINAYKNGISASHSVPHSTVQDIINLYKSTGEVDQKTKTGQPSTITEANRRALRRIGKEKPLLTTLQKRNRLKWAREHQNWSQRQWGSIIWSDESKTVNAQNDKEILEESFLPSIPQCATNDGDFMFQQDGAPCHTAKTIHT